MTNEQVRAALDWLRDYRGHLWRATPDELAHMRACTAPWDDGCHYLQSVETLEKALSVNAGATSVEQGATESAQDRSSSVAVDADEGTPSHVAGRLAGSDAGHG